MIQTRADLKGIYLYTYKKEKTWRELQSEYIVKKRKKNLFLITAKTATVLALLLLFAAGIWFLITQIPQISDILYKRHKEKTLSQKPLPPEPQVSEIPEQLSKTKAHKILAGTKFFHTDKNIFFVDTGEDNFKITTSIDVYLQQYALSLLDRAKEKNRGKPQRIALVAIEPDTGKIIAMAGFDLDNPDINPCIQSNYPAASIFKIVTAAAAVETLGYTPGTQLFFNGNKYTLYKRQLKDVKNKYTYKVSFSKAFAESINPVFGKMGKNYLGKEKLESYAKAFGFNKTIQSEIPFFSGHFKTNGKSYHLAELGCGFNNSTTISPIFGAMITSAVVNSGTIMMPGIIEHITDSDGQIIYKNQKTNYTTAIKPGTAEVMMKLMQRTVSRGTARKAFRGSSKDSVLSNLVIGGKTGSLYNREHTVKYDWFAGFAQKKKTGKKIALSVVVGHRKYIGTRAGTYAKLILKKYYEKNSDNIAQL